MAILRYKELIDLTIQINKCNKCNLYKTRHKAVPGEGNINAKIMIIGQAPGKQEDRSGKPFVGRSGELLNKVLNMFGKRREEFFITSILKCFPPGNRKPKANEIKACLPYTLKQISIIKPKWILLLGEIATKTLLNVKFSNVRGTFVKKESISYFPTYHPAAALRFLKIKMIFIADLEKFFKEIEKNKE